MGLTIRGMSAMRNQLRKIAKTYPDRVGRALYLEAQIEATEMKKRTPVDTRDNAPHPGNLRNSIHVQEPEMEGSTISVTIATGSQAPYAIYVHENPDAFHPIGQWKFMESVLNESVDYMAERVAKRIKF